MATQSNTNNLKFFDLPNLESIDDLSEELRISKKLIYSCTKFNNKFYKIYKIKKSSKGYRTISQPNSEIKAIQGWILHEVLYKVKSSEYSKGFDQGNSIVENAEVHIGNNCILNLDIKDFFDSINENDVYKLFRKIGYNNEISFLFSKICTLENRLPQGAPTSSKIANLICWNLDLRIGGFISKRGFNFSRYADDISISGLVPRSIKSIIPKIYGIIKDEGFNINYKKTRVQDLSGSRSVTGLYFYDDIFGIGSSQKKLIRARLFNFLMKEEFHNEKERNYLNGWFSYIKSVDEKRFKYFVNYYLKFKIEELCLIKYKINVLENIKKNKK